MKELIKETLSKSDVKSELTTFLSSNVFKQKIEQIVKDRIKNEKGLEDKVIEITKNVLTQLYKNLWVKRNVWRDNLSNKSS